MGLQAKVVAAVLAAILILGGLLRFQVVSETTVIDPIRVDALKYSLYAYNLKFHGVYTHSQEGLPGRSGEMKPDALVTPGYPLFLGLFIDERFSADRYQAILLAQALLSTLTIGAAYLVFARIGGAAVGLASALLTALSPHLINMNVYVISETLFCFALTGFLASLPRYGTEGATRWVLSGTLFGAATLVRSWVQVYALLLVPFLLMAGNKRRLRGPVWLLVGFLAIVGPWLARNYVSLGTISDASLSVASVYHGSFPDMVYQGRPETLGFAYRFDPKAGEVSSSFSVLVPELWNRARGNPAEYLQWYLFGKTATVFSWSILGGEGDIFQYPVSQTPFATKAHFLISYRIMRAIHSGLVVCALLGCIAAWMPNRWLRCSDDGTFVLRAVSLLFLYFIVMHVIGAPYPRYSIPMRPLIYGMAVFFLVNAATVISVGRPGGDAIARG